MLFVTSPRQAASNKVSRPTISKLWKDRESVKKDGLETENKERKRKRPFKEEDVERALKIWLDQKNEQHARVNAPLLKEKARQIAEKIGHTFELSPSKRTVPVSERLRSSRGGFA